MHAPSIFIENSSAYVRVCWSGRTQVRSAKANLLRGGREAYGPWLGGSRASEQQRRGNDAPLAQRRSMPMEQGGTRMLLRRKLSASLSAAAMLAAMMLVAPAALAQTSEGSASASATASPSVTATDSSTAAVIISAASSVPPSATVSASATANAMASGTALAETDGPSYVTTVAWVAAIMLLLSGLAVFKFVLRRGTA